MDRRSLGVVLVAVVILVAVVVPAWGGRRMPGSALMSPTPGPPRVGDCLHMVPSSRSALDYLPPLLAAGTGPCGEANFGEVVAVAQDVGQFPSTTGNGLSGPNVLACDPLTRQYLGWPALQMASDRNQGASTLVNWRPLNTVSSGLIGPDLRQYFAGQGWVACVAYPEFAPFQGSIRDSVWDGRSADSYAACLPLIPDPTAQLVSCAQPHRTEVFGWTTDSVAKGNLSTSCADLVLRITGMPDKRAGGALTVGVLDPTGGGVIGDAATSTAAGDRPVCAVTVTGSRRLVGTLIGIGENGLPWE